MTIMTTIEQANAIVAEFRRDAIKEGVKILSGGFAKIESTFGGVEYKCIYHGGRINWYVSGKLVSEKEATAKLDISLIAERVRF